VAVTLNATPDDRELTLAPLDGEVDHLRGSPAGHLIIEYGDYECRTGGRHFTRSSESNSSVAGHAVRVPAFSADRLHPHALATAAGRRCRNEPPSPTSPGVSQYFKTWVDMVIADPRMAAGTKPVLAGKPAVLVTVRGGNYRPGTPREGWDHASGWMRRILGDVWQLDLRAVEAEFTNVGVNPALGRFQDLARQLRREAEEQARRHGRELAAPVAMAAPKAA
jgi:hypothetical protein